MPHEPNAELHSQLEAAITAVRQQIAIQSTADHYLGSERIAEEALSELRSELMRLQEALASLA